MSRRYGGFGTRRAARDRGRRLTDFLLNYHGADVFNRATEAACSDTRPPLRGGTGAFAGAFLDVTEEGNWPPSGVPRIFTDGAYLCESARKNDLAESWFDDTLWATTGSAVLTSDDAASPDFDSTGESAATVVFSASAADGVSHVTTIGAGVGTDNDSAFVSCWLRSTSGTEEARLGLIDKDGITLLLSGNLTLTTTWTRFSFNVVDIGAGVLSPVAILYNSTDAAARTIEPWGFQVEHNAEFPSTTIRSSGASATRNLDDMRFAAGSWSNRLATGKSRVSFVPNFDAVDRALPASVYLFASFGSAHYLRIRIVAAVWRVQFFNNAGESGGNMLGGTAPWVAGDLITITTDHVSGVVECTRNGVDALVAPSDLEAAGGSWDNTADTLFVGQNTGNTEHIEGVMTQPVPA